MKHNVSPSLRLILLSVAALAPATSSPAEASPRRALPPRTMPAARLGNVVVAGHGEKRGRAGEAWVAVDVNGALPSHGEVRAGQEPLRLRIGDGAEIELSPGSALRLAAPIDLVLAGRGKLTVDRVDLLLGELTVRASRTPVLVEGPGQLLAVALEGTMMRTRVLARRGELPGGLAVASYQGDARVATRGAFRALEIGKVIELHGGLSVPAAKPLASSPTWIHEESSMSTGPLAVVSASNATASLALRFSPVDSASGYELEIARDEGFSTLVATRDLRPTMTEIETPALPVGRYFARVLARGSEGLPGLPGPTRALRVALAKLPSGGITAGDTFLLPRDRGITWDDPSGLEVSVGRIGFVRAAASIGLIRDARTVARVRLAGERSFVQLALLPTTVHANIDLGPKRAVWPNDPIEILVHLVGLDAPEGGVDAAPFAPKLRVAVNLDEVPVKWRHEGNLFRATVPPSRAGGPWVVRVEATDLSDNTIGRGSLEVVSSR